MKNVARCTVIAALLVIGISSNSYAYVLDQGDYVTDTTSGLDWLKLDDSRIIGQSVTTVRGLLGAGAALEGWRYAYSTDLQGLLSNYFGTVVPENTPLADPYALDGFIKLIGSTANSYTQSIGFANQIEHLSSVRPDITWITADYITGWLADQTIPNEYWNACINSTSWIEGGRYINGAYVFTSCFSSEEILANPYISSFLIRDSVATVSEPGTFSMLLAGLGIIGAVVRKRNKAA